MTELHQAAAAGDLDEVEEILLQRRCNPNQRDVDWSHKTALHWAAARGEVSAASVHLSASALLVGCAEKFSVMLRLKSFTLKCRVLVCPQSLELSHVF